MGTHRTLVLLEPPIRQMVKEKAKIEGVSVSSVCRDLIRLALEINEDRYFNKLAFERDKNFNWEKHGILHDKAWGKKHK